MNAQWKRSISVLLLTIFLGNMLPYAAYSQSDSPSVVDPVAQATAQPNRLFLPVVRQASLMSCGDKGFAVSKTIHPKGKTLADVADDYLMSPHDLLGANNDGIFGTDFNDYKMQRDSRVCLAFSYRRLWNPSNSAYIIFNDKRDQASWNEYLLNPREVAASTATATTQTTDTFIFTTPTFPITGKLFQVVGEWFLASGARGGFVARVAPGSFGAGLLKGVGTKIGYAILAASVGITTANAVHYPATGLKSGAYMFYYQALPANGLVYVRCYANGIDVGKARNDLIQMLVYEGSGTDLKACPITAGPQGVASGALAAAHGWRLVQRATLEMVQQSTVKDDDAALIIAKLEDYYSQDEDRPVGGDPGQECQEFDVISEWKNAVEIAILAADYKFQRLDLFGEVDAAETMWIAVGARDYPYLEELQGKYKEIRPRKEGSLAMVTTQHGSKGPEPDDFHYNVNMICLWSTPMLRYVWFPDLRDNFKGRTESGLVRDTELLEPPHPYITPPYPYIWSNYPFSN